MSNQLAVGLAATGWRAMSSMRRSSPPSRGSASSSRAIPNARPPIPAPTSCPTRPTCATSRYSLSPPPTAPTSRSRSPRWSAGSRSSSTSRWRPARATPSRCGPAELLTVFQNRRYDGDFLTVQAAGRRRRLGELLRLESRFDRARQRAGLCDGPARHADAAFTLPVYAHAMRRDQMRPRAPQDPRRRRSRVKRDEAGPADERRHLDGCRVNVFELEAELTSSCG